MITLDNSGGDVFHYNANNNKIYLLALNFFINENPCELMLLRDKQKEMHAKASLTNQAETTKCCIK